MGLARRRARHHPRRSRAWSRAPRRPVALDPLLDRLRPDVVHVHTVVNPTRPRIRGRARRRVHRPGPPRASVPRAASGRRRTRSAASRSPPPPARACFQDRAYYDEVLALTQARLAAIRKATVLVLSEYMRGRAGGGGRRPGAHPRRPAFRRLRGEGGRGRARRSALRPVRGPARRGQGPARRRRGVAAIGGDAAPRRRGHGAAARAGGSRGGRGARMGRPRAAAALSCAGRARC